MKNILFICSSFICLGIFSQTILIPDANFKAALIAHTPVIDTSGDGDIQIGEALGLSGLLNIQNKSIVDPTGIEEFINITDLRINNNLITTLNLSQNTNLTNLLCYSNPMDSLNVSMCTNLDNISASDMNLTSIDLTNNTLLTNINLRDNQLTSIDVSNNTIVDQIDISENLVDSINVANNTLLEALLVDQDSLTSLDLTNNPLLKYLNFEKNQISSINLTQNTELISLTANFNLLTELDLSQNTLIETIRVSDNQIEKLDLTTDTAIEFIDINRNSIDSLDLSNNQKVTGLFAVNNGLVFLDLRNGNDTLLSPPYLGSNPNLFCVSVDDSLYAEANWRTGNTSQIGSHTLFNGDCSSFCNPILELRTVSGCDEYIYYGDTITNSIIRIDTIINLSGCRDSIITLDLTIGTTTFGIDSVHRCDNSFTWTNGVTYVASNYTAKDTVINSSGCDSIISLHLIIDTTTYGIDSVYRCDSFTWMNGITYTSSNDTSTFIVSNSNGCDSIITLYLTIPLIDTIVTISNDTLFANEDSASYQWFNCTGNTPIITQTDQYFVPSSSGLYSVELTMDGCIKRSTCFNYITTNISNYENNEISIFPNPSNGFYTINLRDIKPYDISILDINGRVIQSFEIENKSSFNINLKNQNSGIYFLNIITNNEVITKRLIKK